MAERNGEKSSLILITVDCLRADHCGFHGYARATTPFLDSLAAESVIVPAIVGGAPTYYSLPAIVASRHPMALGRDVIGIAPGEATLAGVLQKSGYATAAFTAGNPYISPRYGYHQGFDVFRDYLDYKCQPADVARAESVPAPGSFRTDLNRSIEKLARTLGCGSLYDDLYFQYCMKVAPPVTQLDDLRIYPAADVLVSAAESWLASVGDRPFFLWLHLMDPHSPYYPPSAAFRDLTGKDLDPARARYLNAYWNRSNVTPSGLRKKHDDVVELYDAGIRWVDRQVQRLAASLQQMKRWDDCVFTLTADHGEEFLEHGGRYHSPVRLCEETVRVPLLIRMPGLQSGRRSGSPISHLHLAPTLLEWLNVPAPPSFRGRSACGVLEADSAEFGPAVIECGYGCTNPFVTENRMAPRLLAVRDRRFKLVFRLADGGIEELYDLESDPSETRPIAMNEAKQARKKLLQVALEHLQSAAAFRDTSLRLRARLHDIRTEMLG